MFDTNYTKNEFILISKVTVHALGSNKAFYWERIGKAKLNFCVSVASSAYTEFYKTLESMLTVDSSAEKMLEALAAEVVKGAKIIEFQYTSAELSDPVYCVEGDTFKAAVYRINGSVLVLFNSKKSK